MLCIKISVCFTFVAKRYIKLCLRFFFINIEQNDTNETKVAKLTARGKFHSDEARC
jgi:hypothetical protein